MTVPDKIYLQTCGDCPGFECESCQFQDLTEVSWSEDKIFGTDKEYIRKDALIEWAKENIDSLGRLSYGEFIDKLNSM